MRQARTSGVAPAAVGPREDDECPTSTVHVRESAERLRGRAVTPPVRWSACRTHGIFMLRAVGSKAARS